MRIAIVSSSSQGSTTGNILAKEYTNFDLFTSSIHGIGQKIDKLSSWYDDNRTKYDGFIFVGSLGICVRTIAPFLENKRVDPAVVNVDVLGNIVTPVVSGHIGGANILAKDVAKVLGGFAAISTVSDTIDLWALDTIDRQFDYTSVVYGSSLNDIIALFVNKRRGALLLEIKDEGAIYLDRTAPDHLDVFYKKEDLDDSKYDFILQVTPFRHQWNCPSLQWVPKVLHIGMGCHKTISPKGLSHVLEEALAQRGIYKEALASLNSADIRAEEPALLELSKKLDIPFNTYNSDQLNRVDIPNPSDIVYKHTGFKGVSESSVLFSESPRVLLVPKTKMKFEEMDFTFAVSMETSFLRSGHVEIVGAGPGDPELVSVRGKNFLKEADLILYAGSLVPKELTEYAKPGATVRSSASMNLEEQVALMTEFYNKGLLVVRLHTGDPCIYGAIQEQMAQMEKNNMSCHITPGISSFQAAAAQLKSQFTIPEKTQTIILTRGEGRTKMPDGEKLHQLARSQSTMCIYLSATLVDSVQEQLLEHYSPDTPVAVCHKLTWKDEKIFRGALSELASLVKDNNLTLTTLIVVGEAIGNRKGLSRLYAHEFKHLYRT
ncbi:precorrin-4 C(11)-methyltransferase [Halosquirtibacter laminarini]|uniref:Precorrin-4 C(11)-methyltransferase n=1 Tax=Halosquirtibacter laminarini TaxID=3374600 RepID=A0AC61NNF9_9BACT|nr:precorrin-4 C(11)-methyltransferase [Prolixibacteraceae bacterium]